jgi:hypothetical protein
LDIGWQSERNRQSIATAPSLAAFAQLGRHRLKGNVEDTSKKLSASP